VHMAQCRSTEAQPPRRSPLAAYLMCLCSYVAHHHATQLPLSRGRPCRPGAPPTPRQGDTCACTIGTFTHVVCNFYMIGKTTDKSMNSVPTSSRCICFQVSVLKFVCVRVINFWLAMPAACTVLLLKIAFSANRQVSIV
jgi:hypothetical protein